MIALTPELLLASGLVYRVSVAPGGSVSALVVDEEGVSAEIGYLPTALGEVVGGILEVHPGQSHLKLAFNKDGEVTYEDLSFGFEWFNGETLIASQSWPPPNVRFVSSDQQWLAAVSIAHEPDTDYRLRLWASDRGETFESNWLLHSPPIPIGEESDE